MKLSAPRQGTFFVALGLYAFAALSHFGVLRLNLGELPTYAWLGGFGLLLLACVFRGL